MPRINKISGKKLEAVEYRVAELLLVDERAFSMVLFEHTEVGKFPENDFIEAKKQCDAGESYRIYADNNMINKMRSWIDCLRFFKSAINENRDKWPDDFPICFEYKIFDGTRVDVILVGDKKLVLLEFKSGKDRSEATLLEHRTQILGYYNRIRYNNKNIWQEVSQGSLEVKKYIVYTSAEMIGKVEDEDLVLFINHAAIRLSEEVTIPAGPARVDSLLEFTNQIDPSIAGAFQSLLRTGVLNYVKAETRNIIACTNIIDEVLNGGQNTLGILFVKGAPGTGKTGTAFSLLEKCIHKIDREGKPCSVPARYVTGNGNLATYFTQMIKHARCEGSLDESLIDIANTMVGRVATLYDVDGYCKYYLDGVKLPTFKFNEQVVLVDEAQRMWNPMQIALRKDRRNNYEPVYTKEQQCFIVKENLSESYLLLYAALSSILSYHKSKCIVFFLGLGQEINSGEENGEESVIDAVIQIWSKTTKVPIKAFVPDKEMKSRLEASGIETILNEDLILGQNQRKLESDPKLEIANGIIAGNIVGNITTKFGNSGYKVYSDFEPIKKALMDREREISRGVVINSYDTYREKGASGAKYELPGSMEALEEVGRDLYEYYHNAGSNALKKFATEFDCQGLEFDMVAMIWGKALLWRKGKWEVNKAVTPRLKFHCRDANAIIEAVNRELAKEGKPQLEYMDYGMLKEQFVKNSYRVLLTRARIETYLYVEDKETYEYLRSIL